MDLFRDDLDSIVDQTGALWEQMRGGRLFLTGGSGFFGSWLLESFVHANHTLDLKASVVVLTRDPERFHAARSNSVLDSSVTLHAGDIRNFDFPSGHFSHIIHAATPSNGVLKPETLLDIIIDGTRRVLDFALHSGARRFLLTSSGAVYGKQPPDVARVAEGSAGAPDTMNPDSAYSEGKRVAELLCAIYSSAHGIETTIARCFAFVGPRLPLDAHFAAGNFIRDSLAGGPIQVRGDASTVRSYLYAADLATWLWTILFSGDSCRPYNVGSDHEITIGDLARAVGRLRPEVGVEIGRKAAPGAQPDRYVPDVTRAYEELGVTQRVELADALSRTSRWAREGQNR
jgi:nucleoside-diphosphate-sugar epimerase